MVSKGNGQQIAEVNFQKFITWLSSKTDDDFRQIVNMRDGVLSRKEIAAECAFGGSAINQNPRIKAALLGKEAELRERGILPPLVTKGEPQSSSVQPKTVPVAGSPKSFDAERLRRLELENASLKTENQELKRQLDKFAVLREVLSTTGRLPR
ncbi:VPA1267 family protein [Rugamonas apoptosis]|uniref:Uncharacterized protein n=1 Tax=Rugamonas apoptosis TaxID=2758570 RepID=A0A7W2F6L5_9BURK|nr:VPA1267 family protein [Rugamonas apoptosis]MBA5686082.1 hypothetical protein [Rugamonas apoptosis]